MLPAVVSYDRTEKNFRIDIDFVSYNSSSSDYVINFSVISQ